MAHDVFISHSARDKETADAVCATLEANRIRCWIAPRDVLPGVRWADAVVDAINESRIMVLVFSSHSNNSDQVMSEVEVAVNKGIPIIPLKIEDVPLTRFMQYYIANRHWLDALTPPLERHLQHLAETVKVLLARIEDRDQVPVDERPTEAPTAPQPTTRGAPGMPTPVRRTFDTARRWGARHVVWLAAIFGAAVVGAAVAVFLLLGRTSDGDGGSVVLPSTTPGGLSPTAVRTPPPSPTRASGELFTSLSARTIGGLSGRIRGITWDGTDLWLTTNMDLFKMNTSGKVLGTYAVPEYSPEGLAWDGEAFWLFTTNWGYIYRFSLEESDGVLTPRTISTFESPNRRYSGGRYDGLAWDGEALWYSDEFTAYRLDTAGKVLSSFALDHEIEGLTWDGEHLWLAYDPPHQNSGEYATFIKTDTEGNRLLTFSGLVTDVDALAWKDGHLLVVGTENLPGAFPSKEPQQLIYEVVELETIVVGLTPTATPKVIEFTPAVAETPVELTPTATPTVEESEATTWSGTTAQGRTVEFDVTEDGGAITRIKIDVEGECPLSIGGTGLQPTGCTCEVKTETKMTNPWPIAEAGFSYAPGDYEFSAVFDSSTTAHGFVRVHSSGTAGQAACSSDQVTWTASPQ